MLSSAYRARQAVSQHSLDPQLEVLWASLISPPNRALGAASLPPASTRSRGRQGPESEPRTQGSCWGSRAAGGVRPSGLLRRGYSMRGVLREQKGLRLGLTTQAH